MKRSNVVLRPVVSTLIASFVPSSALSEFKAGSYDLMLTDVRMPKMTGFDLYRKLEDLDPIVKICFIAGYEIYCDGLRRVFPKIKVGCFVKKPVRVKELANLIEAELSRNAKEGQSFPWADRIEKGF